MDDNVIKKLKEPLSLDMKMVMSKISQKGELNRDTALEAGAHIAAQFINALNKMTKQDGEAILNSEERDQIFVALEELFDEEFEKEYSRVDYDRLRNKALELLNSDHAEDTILAYFNDTLKKED